jgi:hypothetical protein
MMVVRLMISTLLQMTYMILNMTVTAPIWTNLSYNFQILAK